MKLTTIGLNHQTAPLSIREKLAFTAAQLPEALRDLALHAAEAVILSTCNRTELYCVGDADAVIEWLAHYHNVSEAEIRPYLYTLGCSQTIHHAFRVACGLDSMVLGEPQILGQMKEAVRVAKAQNSVGTWLNALFQRTFAAAKEVRTHSGVGDNVVSMASAAYRMAEQVFSDIHSLNILFVGAGEMNESVAAYFAAKQPRIAGSLHHIIRGGNQAAAAKGENHGIGVQRTDAPEVKPRRNVRQIQRGPAQFCGGIHAHKHPNDAPNHRHNGELAHHFIVIGLRFHNNSIR